MRTSSHPPTLHEASKNPLLDFKIRCAISSASNRTEVGRQEDRPFPIQAQEAGGNRMKYIQFPFTMGYFCTLVTEVGGH